MENKYYTPKLNEFHIGFRFEFYRTLTTYIEGQEPIVSSDWLEADVATDFPNITIPMIDAMLDKGHIRVKELDEADIIEVGWILKKNYKTIFEYILKGHKGEADTYLTFRLSGHIEIHNNGDNREDYYSYFDGKIKNYNELLKVMEMLGIKKEE